MFKHVLYFKQMEILCGPSKSAVSLEVFVRSELEKKGSLLKKHETEKAEHSPSLQHV